VQPLSAGCGSAPDTPGRGRVQLRQCDGGVDCSAMTLPSHLPAFLVTTLFLRVLEAPDIVTCGRERKRRQFDNAGETSSRSPFASACPQICPSFSVLSARCYSYLRCSEGQVVHVFPSDTRRMKNACGKSACHHRPSFFSLRPRLRVWTGSLIPRYGPTGHRRECEPLRPGVSAFLCEGAHSLLCGVAARRRCQGLPDPAANVFVLHTLSNEISDTARTRGAGRR
jgi:hypothetical protein